jgi:hypothetical protein
MENEYTTQPEAEGTQLQGAKWHAPLTTVTTLSKALAVIIFIALPFIGFWFGMQYGAQSNSYESLVVEVPAVAERSYKSEIETFFESFSSGIDETKLLSVIENTEKYVRFEVEESTYGFAKYSQYIFTKKSATLEQIVNCGIGCTKVDPNTVVRASEEGVYLETFKAVNESGEAKLGFVPTNIYTLSPQERGAGYQPVYLSSGDPCRKCGHPEVTALPDNKLKLVLYRGTGEDEGGGQIYETKEVIVDLPR